MRLFALLLLPLGFNLLPQSTHAEQLKALLAQPTPATPVWRARVYDLAVRLELDAPGLAEQGLALLATHGNDADRANWVLLRRRQGVEATEQVFVEKFSEPPQLEALLELALAAWGRGDLATARALFLRAPLAEDGLPADPRHAENLAWLDRRPNRPTPLHAGPRTIALAVLAARNHRR